ncbi:hypothetical protein QR680_004889 [Steinernema hermaphroditum]|uniref:Peptidase M16 C-terminal domain-containing protein n=1 Tax=Steinernema hermaphroditum TaxID=289476 RepID=A0AA39LUR0_9BILA|nr:hypothetical protein QR680_004889 [Steinernema hermaphroditum]
MFGCRTIGACGEPDIAIIVLDTIFRISTVGFDIRDELLRFFDRHYSSNRMCLCIVGKLGVHALEEMVLNLPLHKIRNKNVEAKIYKEHFWGPDELSRRVDIVPILDQHILQIHFAVDDFSPFWKSGPGNHLSRPYSKNRLRGLNVLQSI